MYYFLEDFSRIGIMCKYIDITMVSGIEQKSPRPENGYFSVKFVRIYEKPKECKCTIF